MTTTNENETEPVNTPVKPPMPVPSITSGMPAPKGLPKQDHIQNDDSGQTGLSPHKTDQIDTGDSIPSTISESPVSPSSKDIPALPFNKNDVMAGKKLQETPQVPAVIPDIQPPATSVKDLDKQMEDKKTASWLQSQGKSYKVQGNYRPDAASIQGAANKNKVSTEILKATQNKDFAEVIVRTHLGAQYVDTVVHHSFETSRQIKLLEMATKHPETVSGFASDGLPMFIPGATFLDNNNKKKDLMLTIMHTLLADIQFSIRDATTKASAAGQAKILNQEWQEDEEKESEAHERELVTSLQDQ